jgi:hypothetical protein
LHTATVNGQSIGYSSETAFLVQVGKNSSAYRTRSTFKGNFAQVWTCFAAINVGNGYKKRILMPSCNRNPVIARQFS